MFIYLITALCVGAQLNEYEMNTGDDGSDIWRSTSDFIPVQRESTDTGDDGSITIGELMIMEFDFVWGGYTNDPYDSGNQFENFFRVGYSHFQGASCDGHGSRYPYVEFTISIQNYKMQIKHQPNSIHIISFRSMWMSPSGQENPNKIHVSHSYEGACQAQDPAQTLDDFGEITIGESYHIIIDTNYTFTTVYISSNDNNKSGIYHFARAFPTDPSHIGTTANVYFMTGKFGSGFYNRGNGTFSNIVLTSRVFTSQPTREPTTPTLNPIVEPSADPTTNPTVDPTTYPTADPSTDPTDSPTHDPSTDPSIAPTIPTNMPSDDPTHHPTDNPTMEPTTKCQPLQNCTQCVSLNIGVIPQCFWHNVGEHCLYRNELSDDESDENLIYEVGTCPQSGQQSDVPISIWYVNGGIMAGVGVFNAIAIIDAKLLRQNDYFQPLALVKAMFGILDVISDVMFSLTVTAKHSKDDTPLNFVIVACWTTIAVPVLLSVWQLWRRSRSVWLREDVPRQWLSTNSFIMFILPFFCGSGFVAIAILNSNLFQLGVFSMGLSKTELSRFSLQRIWSIILLEVLNVFFIFCNLHALTCNLSQNIPQLSLNIWFMVVYGFHDVAMASAIFAVISLMVTIMAICTQRDIHLYRQCVSVQFTVKGVPAKDRKLQLKTRGIAKEISSLLGLDDILVDIEQPRGFIFKMHLYINGVQYKDVDYKSLMENAVSGGTLGEIIRNQWKLQKVPAIADFKYEEIQSEFQLMNVVEIFVPKKSIAVHNHHQILEGSRLVEGTSMADGIQLAAMPKVVATPFDRNVTLDSDSEEGMNTTAQ